MGGQETQTQVEENRSRSGLYRSLAPAFRHVFSSQTGPDGVQSENRVQQADLENWRRRQPNFAKGRLSSLWNCKDGLRALTRHDPGASQEIGRASLSSSWKCGG